MISKELLSAVLKNELPWNSSGFNICRVEQNKVVYGIEFSFRREINIYELSHKCKEWAKILGIEIDSHYGCARWGASAERHISSYSVFYEQVFIASTEPEAIFKACEWILEQKDNQ